MAKVIKTIEGKAMWAKVFEPDTKFNPDGDYSINLLMSEEQAAEMGEYLEGLTQEKFNEEVKRNPKLKNTLSIRPPYEPAYDRDGNETGDVEFKFKLKAKVQTRDGQTYEQKPVVVDAKRVPMNGEVLVGNGSVVKVAFEPIPYVIAATKMCGVSLRLKGVQVLDLVEYGNSGASMFEEEDGYVAQAIEKDDASEVPFDEAVDATVEGDF